MCCLCARHLGGVRPMMLNSCQAYVEAGKMPLQQTRSPQLNLTRPRLCLPTQPKDTNKMWTHHQHSPSDSGSIRLSAQEPQSLSRQTAGHRSDLPPSARIPNPAQAEHPATEEILWQPKKTQITIALVVYTKTITNTRKNYRPPSMCTFTSQKLYTTDVYTTKL